jgi:aminopeptidase N
MQKDQGPYQKYWENARKMILEKNEFGRRANDAGPIWMGLRLNTFKTASAYRRMIYPKGGYVLHMLRYLMQDENGDQNFLDTMHEFVKSYFNRNPSTEQFIQIIDKHITPKLDLERNGKMTWFFREWVYGTEIPSYKLEYSLTSAEDGKFLLTGKVTQSDVSGAFKMRVPVYADIDGKLFRLGSLGLIGSQTTPEFKIKLPKKPKRVLLNANHDVLASSEKVEQQ